ncbi:MAG TPA: hypothetical protein VGG68_08715 [Caulobacteraceae bacterium]
MRLLIVALAAALASFSAARAQEPPQANCPAQAPHSLPLFFADNQAGLTPEAQVTLAQAVQFAQACPVLTLTIIAYPGDSGATAADQAVAATRLNVISAALRGMGVAPARLRLVTGLAPAGPAAPTVRGATIGFAAQPQIAYRLRPGAFPGGVAAAPIGAPNPEAPVVIAHDHVRPLPKGPLVAANGGGSVATAAPPPPNPAPAASPGAAPTPGPAPGPTPGAAAAPAPNPGPPAPAPKLTVIYNAPPSIPLGQGTDYRLIIESANPTGAGDFNGAPGPLQSHTIPTLAWARAVMTGPQDLVTVQPVTSAACQEVTSQGNPTWDWQVTPKTNKAFYLTVDIYQVADCNAAGVLDHRVDSFPIKVTETFWSWLIYEWPAWKSALAWVLGTMAAAGGAFGAWTWFKPGKPASS